MDPQSESATVDDQLGFALHAASRAMTARCRPMLASIGLTYPQYLVMMVLWDEGPCTVGELAARLRLDSGTMSPMLRRLESKGLISRTRTDRDERVVTVAVTAHGAELRSQAERVPDRVGDGLAAFDYEKLRVSLRRLEQILHRS